MDGRESTGASAFLLREMRMAIGAEQRAVQVWDDDGGRVPSEKVDVAYRTQGLGKMAVHLARRYPLQIFAGALVLGFVVGRVCR